MLNEGFVDTFRHFYPDLEKKYSFWTYMMNARSKNVGWRLDYFVTSKRLVDQICDSGNNFWKQTVKEKNESINTSAKSAQK